MGFAVRHHELLDDGVVQELEKFLGFLKQFLLKEHNEDGTHIVEGATTDVAAASLAYVTIGNTSSLSAERALTGTANQITITDNGANSTVQLALPQSIATTSSPTFASPIVTSLNIGGAEGAATSCRTLTKKITGIADNTATNILTVTVPNANHATAIRLLLLSSNGSTDAFESSRVATGHVVVARTTGANAVAVAAALDDATIATVSGGATHTLAYNVSSISGAAGAVNTFTIQATIDDSGNLGSNQLVVEATLLNAEATGITIA